MFSTRNMGRLSAAAALLTAITVTATAASAQDLPRHQTIQVIGRHVHLSPAQTTIDAAGLLPNGIVANIGSPG